MYYVFDGSYNGFLSCVFESFDRKEPEAAPITGDEYQRDLFEGSRKVPSDLVKSSRVIKGLQRQMGRNGALDFFRVFLSEDRKAWLSSFRIIHQLFKAGPAVLSNYGDDDVLYFTQTLHKISRESHRMKAFIRFQKSEDGLYFALVEPDFNVLPLISGFFKRRYADQDWLIYDVKRTYGLMYANGSLTEVRPTVPEKSTMSHAAVTVTLDERDEHFQSLWKLYYKSTNIASRRNMKLHLRHVPKRYWKYLPEKQ